MEKVSLKTKRDSEDNQQKKRSSQKNEQVDDSEKDPIVILRRLRQKIDAIRVLDPYYQTKLTQNELDRFMQSRDALQKEITEREKYRNTGDKSQHDKLMTREKQRRKKECSRKFAKNNGDDDDYEHPSGMSFAQFRTLLTNCSTNPMEAITQ
ncbi:hypothetical protein HELRODRAFT_170885 [Helobdella robusta]|uniref:Uncharacterized protein n=1 Tax=Helobdella robusta TaxID=6412 RepID=T1F3J8_HELRO|nr:hypothetical protein HELRODRAFT_170885 [Helobdella robusta]ESO06859.1 hypothetical protein HELRODRAFT_170885 [Helobdella robusta]